MRKRLDYAISSSTKPSQNQVVSDLGKESILSGFNQVNDFIDSDIGFEKSSCKHILLLYEEAEPAMKIKLRYLKSRLQKGERCACLVCGDGAAVNENIRAEMAGNEIDVDPLEKTGQLRIVTISDPRSAIRDYNPENADGILQTLLDKIWEGAAPPSAGFGIVASKDDLIKPERLALQIELERLSNIITQSSNTRTWMCPYHVDNIAESLDREWVLQLLLNHDSVIYVPKNSNGIALKLS